MAGDALASTEAKVRRIASDIDRVRKLSNRAEAYRKATTDRANAAEGRKGKR